MMKSSCKYHDYYVVHPSAAAAAHLEGVVVASTADASPRFLGGEKSSFFRNCFDTRRHDEMIR